MKKHFGFIVFLMSILLLAGCGKTDRGAQDSAKEENPTENAQTLGTTGESSKDKLVYLDHYEQWVHSMEGVQAENLSYVGSGVCENYFWYLGAVLTPEGLSPTSDQDVYVLDLYDVKEKKQVVRSFTPREIGAVGDIGRLTGMDMLAADSYMFRWSRSQYSYEDEMYTMAEDQIIFTDLAGNNTKRDFIEIFRREGLEPYEECSWPCSTISTCKAMRNGDIWVWSWDRETMREKICVFGRNGERVFTYEGQNQEQVWKLVEREDGQLLLPVFDMEGCVYNFYSINTDNGTMELLATLKQSSLRLEKIYAMEGDRLFCQAVNQDTGIGSGVVVWDIISGEKNWLLNYDFANSSYCDTTLAFSEDGIASVLLRYERREIRKDWIISVSDELHVEDGAIRVANLESDGNQLRLCARYSTLLSPNRKYVYEDASSDEARQRILLELMQGGGPQLLFVDAEDFYNLSSKGILADMDPLITEDTRELFLPAALDMCRVDGKLLGIPVGVYIETMAVPKGCSDWDDWTLEHVLELMAEGKLNPRIRSPYYGQGEYMSAASGAVTLLDYSFEDSFLIDRDNKTCHFDDERFIDYLELVKSSASGVVSQDPEKDVIWGYLMVYQLALEMAADVAREGWEIVGFPGQSEQKGYILPTDGVLVVNANTKDDEVVSDFITNLLDKDIQYDKENRCMSVRKFVPEDFLTTNREGKQFYFGIMEADRVVEEGKTNPLDILKDLLENSSPLLPRYETVTLIINEELYTMIREGKSAEETAKTINSRVEIYLNEKLDN